MLTGTQEQEPAVVTTPMNEAAGRVLKNVTFQSAPAAVSKARRMVGDLVADHPAAFVIELLTSELVTNAVIHGQSDLITMTVMRTFTGLKVSVADSGPGFIPGFVPMTSGEAEGVDARDAAEEYGRGLVLVATLALQWGTIQDSRGATVWFTMGDRAPDAWRI